MALLLSGAALANDNGLARVTLPTHTNRRIVPPVARCTSAATHGMTRGAVHLSCHPWDGGHGTSMVPT